MTAISLCVALPINYSGNMRDGNDTFSLTTMSNVDPMSSWMWIYTIISLSYLPIGCYVIRKFLKQVKQLFSHFLIHFISIDNSLFFRMDELL